MVRRERTCGGWSADYRRATGGRAVFVGRTGKVLADSGPASDASQAFANRPEIRAALAGREVSGRRHSTSLGADLLYVAVPVSSGGRVLGAVRVTYPTSFVDRRVRRSWLVLAAVGGVVILVVLLVSLVLARSVTRPLPRPRGHRHAPRARAISPLGPTSADLPRWPCYRPRSTPWLHSWRSSFARKRRSSQTRPISFGLPSPRCASGSRTPRPSATRGQRDDLDAAVSEVVRLSRMVDGLLALARTERAGPRPELMDLAEIVEGRRIAWSTLAEERDVHLVVWAEPRLEVMARPDHIEQVLDNLLANTLEVSPPSTVITIRAARASRWIDVHVTDQGPGIAPEERAHAFDRFWRAASTSSRDGTGLGLAIVHRLVVSEGGTVELREAAGGGLDAVVRLPAATRASTSR